MTRSPSAAQPSPPGPSPSRPAVPPAALPPAHCLVVTGPGPGTGRGAGSGLRLRPWRPDDAPAVVRGVADPEFRRWNTPKLPVVTEADALDWIRRRAVDHEHGTGCALAITPADGDEAIGSISLGVLDLWTRRGKVGYWVLPEARGRGVARGALDLFSRWAFEEVGLHRLELGHAVGHDISCRVAERCGYRYEGTLRGEMFEAGDPSRFRDAHLHARLATDS